MISVVRRRHFVNGIAVGLAMAATAFGLVILALILGVLVYNGLGALAPSLFLQDTPAPPGLTGGLRNAIYGSLVMTVTAIVIAAPVGIMAGTYLAEYGRASKVAEVVRFINDVLLSAPSIIIGLFVYQLMVVTMRHFSAWAGAVALAVIAVPVIVRTTEDMLSLVPDSLREAGIALGAPKWKVILSISYKAAFQGVMTGVLLAVARVSGETAPLLFTSLNNQFFSTNMNAPMANLPVVIFQFSMSPYVGWQRLAWGGAFLITAAVLCLNISVRLIAHWNQNSR